MHFLTSPSGRPLEIPQLAQGGTVETVGKRSVTHADFSKAALDASELSAKSQCSLGNRNDQEAPQSPRRCGKDWTLDKHGVVDRKGHQILSKLKRSLSAVCVVSDFPDWI